MSDVTFADVVHQSISFSPSDPTEALILDLIDTRWFQRLRDVSQTANTRLVYMFSEHSRFGHCIGVAYLTKMLLDKLSRIHFKEVEEFRAPVLAAALLHDIGHLAPGSHMAFKAWFPEQEDIHEQIAANILTNDPEISSLLKKFSPALLNTVTAILNEDPSIPAWTWQIISGGGWNTDRGNWCIVDSVLAGVSYGKYNIPALVESIAITSDGNLVLMENRLDSMMHFMVSRHAMYRQIYQHRVLLAADMLDKAIVQRARDLGTSLNFADEAMHKALSAKTAHDLDLQTIFKMRESWWRYHLARWAESSDTTLIDLCNRLVDRRLLKTVRVHTDEDPAQLKMAAEAAVRDAGFDPRYYLHYITAGYMHAGDSKQAMLVRLDDQSTKPLSKVDPIFNAMAEESNLSKRAWFAMPAEAKQKLGRAR